MKYVWGIKTSEHFSAGESMKGFRTRHIRGYGCAVTFSSTRIAWSLADATYAGEQWRFMETSFSRS